MDATTAIIAERIKEVAERLDRAMQQRELVSERCALLEERARQNAEHIDRLEKSLASTGARVADLENDAKRGKVETRREIIKGIFAVLTGGGLLAVLQWVLGWLKKAP